MDYQSFLQSKLATHEESGFNCDDLPDYLFDYQRYIVKLALQKGKFAIFAGTGLGKALRNGTGVLTQNGFVAIESLNVGDSVYGSNGKLCNVIGVFPQGVRDLYRVTFSDNTQIDCDGDHLWTTKTRKHRHRGNPGRTMTTLEIIKDGLFDKDGGKRHFIDVIKPIEFPVQPQPLDPYLVGVLLGDGGLSSGSIDLTTDLEIINKLNLPDGITPKLSEQVTDEVVIVRLSLDCGTNGKTYHPLLTELENIGIRGCLSHEKFIPEEYLYGSVDQRIALLNGLLDTDGSTYDGTVEYCTTSDQLALDVQFLVQSLGGTAPIGIKKTHYTYNGELRSGRDAYRLNISLGHFCPFTLSRKVKSWIPKPQRKAVPRSIIAIEKIDSDYATCIKVDSPDSLFVTEGCVLTHNTAMQLTWAVKVAEHTKKPVLILAPLAVAKQTAFDESAKFDVECQYCETQDDVVNGVNITNYQKLDKFDIHAFSGIVLDESSILKSFTGAIRNQLIECFAQTPYRLACSATPSPNDHMELGNHAEFLGIMSRTEMLAQYFIHDSSDTSKWRLKGHASNPFWQWLAQWCIMLQRPSDIGFSDDNYSLPPLNEMFLRVSTDIKREGELFTMAARGLKEQRQAKKKTLSDRVNKIADLVNSSSDQWIVWCETNDESAELSASITDAVEVKGSDSDFHKESSAFDFAHGKIRVLVSKPSIFGFGMNWQNCHNVAFVGLSNSFEMTYQAIRRCYRFGQAHPVNVYYCMTDTDTAIKVNLDRKQDQFKEMLTHLLQHMKKHTTVKTIHQKNKYIRKVARGENWESHLCDCVDLARELESDSIDFSVFSPPFSSLYTYSNSERDMGNCRCDDDFFAHFQFLIAELYRVIRPSRLVSFHCMNLPTSKQNHGYIGLRDFRGDLIRAFESVGFIFHSEVTIWKNPVVAMQRTKALGLLHKQLCKDSAMSRQGIPDYLVTMRKPGDNDQPIDGMLTEYYGDDADPTGENDKHKSINIWQRYASPVWMDIDQSDVLNYRDGRDNDDEKHICPLQLGVIRRAVQLWSNPGDLIYSPFSGIGSEGYVALDMERRFIGSELKESYWNVGIKNLEYISNKPTQLSLIA